MTAGRARRRRRRRAASRLRRATAGNRVYGYALLAVFVLLAAMALGPLQSYTAAADRVDALVERRDVLQEEVDRLEQRRERLHDPEEIELLARSDFGLVRPGEVPYVVVGPETDLDRVHPDGHADASAPGEPGPWYRRLGRWLATRVR